MKVLQLNGKARTGRTLGASCVFKGAGGVATESIVVRGCAGQLVSCNNTREDLLQVGWSHQNPIHFFSLDLWSCHKKPLFLC